MITDTTEADFRALLEADSADLATRLVFADWLEEHGRVAEANGQRWQVRNRQWPRWSISSETWDWWYLTPEGLALSWDDWEGLFCACLPLDVCNQLTAVVNKLVASDGTGWRGWRTLTDAETALAHALHELELTP